MNRPAPSGRGWLILLGGGGWCLAIWQLGQPAVILPGAFAVTLVLTAWLLAFTQPPPTLASLRIHPTTPQVGDRVDIAVVLEFGRRVPTGPLSLRIPTGPGLSELSQTHQMHRQDVQLDARYHADHRGPTTVGPIVLQISDALGLCRSRHRLAGSTSLLVLPEMEPLGPGPSRAGRHDQSVTTASGAPDVDDILLREYRPGDDTRRIHWRSTARTGSLVVRRENQSEGPAATLILDTRGTPGSDLSFEWRIRAAAAIGSRLLAEGHRLQLQGTPRTVVPGQVDVLLRTLAQLSPIDSATLTFDKSPGNDHDLTIAILGKVSRLDIAAIQRLNPRGSTHFILTEPPPIPADSAARSARSWHMVVADPAEPVAAAWSRLPRSPRQTP